MSVRGWADKISGGWRPLRRMAALQQAVAAHLPLLPVVGAQLRDTSRQVEQAVAQVGGNFERMVEFAREGVNQASQLIGAGGEGDGRTGGVEAMLATSRKTLEDLLVRIVQDGHVCNRLVERMDSLERDMQKIVRTLADVDRISFGNTILALNARIEAVHVGERGQGFELIAQELWTQARRSEEITEGIRVTIRQLAGDARAAMTEIGAMACADHDRIAALQGEVREALDRFENAHAHMQRSLAEAGGRSEALSQEIANAVQTMQFQDRVSQRIGHIVEALESMQAALARPMASRDAPVAGAPCSPAATMLSAAYTMDTERSVHAAVMGEAAAAEPLSDVEIF